MRSIALYHIGKTGGTSVMQWLSSVRDEHQRSVFVYRYYQTSCFFTLAHHADIFYSTRDNNGTLVVPTRGDCQHHKIFGGATVFVEFLPREFHGPFVGFSIDNEHSGFVATGKGNGAHD